LPALLANDPKLSVADNQRHRAEAHQRILWPLYPLCLTLVALAVLLSGEFNRRGHWQRIAMAVSVGVIIIFAAVGFRSMMALNPMMIYIAYINLLAPIMVSLWALSDRSDKKAIPQRAVESAA